MLLGVFMHKSWSLCNTKVCYAILNLCVLIFFVSPSAQVDQTLFLVCLSCFVYERNLKYWARLKCLA